MNHLDPAIAMEPFFGDSQRFFTFVKKVVRHELRKNGFTRLTVPLIERTSLLERAFGKDSNIAESELVTFTGKENEHLSLKRDSTIGTMRFYLKNCQDEPQPVYLYYIEPFFQLRQDSQKIHQLYQVGAEIIGETDPVLDAKMIQMGSTILDNL